LYSRQIVTFVVGVLCVCAIDAPPQMQAVPPAPHSIRDLGTLGGNVTSALSITPGASIGGAAPTDAWVAGHSRTATGAQHAFAYNQGQMHDLGTLGGVSLARSVNLYGDVVGESRNRSNVLRAFLYTGGVMQDLGSLSGSGQSFARAINSQGEIVGGTQTTSNIDSTRAFIYRNGAMTLLGTTFGGTKSVANDINDSGDAVGYAYTAGNASYRAALFSGGVTTDLGTLGGNSEATALNRSFLIVGRSRLAGSSAQHAFLTDGGTMRDLGTLGGTNSEALDINTAGAVVGSAQIAGDAAYHAFLWLNGTMIDLNSLLPPGSGWVLRTARSINDGGQIVGHGSLGGQTRAFVMSPPLDLAVSAVGDVDFTSNLPRPVQAGRSVFWTLFVQNRQELGIDATNVVVVDTLTGPVEYTRVQMFHGNGTCEIKGRTLECRFARIDSMSFDAFVGITVRTTGAGVIGHTARIISADQPDPNPANNEESETNTALSVAAVTLIPASVAGGRAVGVHVTLTAPHPNGAGVGLASSNPAVAPVPTGINVIDLTRSFNIIPAVVSAPTTVQISATYGLVTKTATLTVLPPALSTLSLTPTTVIGGCRTVAAKVQLTGAAPASGAPVAINEAIGAAQFPSALVVPAGAFSRTFTIPTSYVTTYQSGPVTATYGGISKAVTLTVRAIRAKTAALSPNPVVGGNTVSGVVSLECPAAPGPIVVSLSSSNSAVAAPTVPTVTIPAGAVSGAFAVKTARVGVPTGVTIWSTVYGTRTATSLMINP
jgi:probable HAF family extracellular repeat protein